MKKQIGILFLTFCALAPASAQNDEFVRQYEEFRKETKGEYDDFRSKANSQYADFLGQAWKSYKAEPPVPKPLDETVPPVVMPVEERLKPIKSVPIVIDDTLRLPLPSPQPIPLSPVIEQPVSRQVEFTAYGTPLRARVGKGCVSLPDLESATLSEAWRTLASGELDNTVIDCLALRDSLHLCDWAYLNLLKALSTQASDSKAASTFLTAFLYAQSGYQMRLGKASGKLYMLVASEHDIYDVNRFNIDGKTFYAIGCDETSMELCDAAFEGEKPLSLLMSQSPSLRLEPTALRTLTSKRYKDMSVGIGVNKNLIDFYNSYPTSCIDNDFMTRWAIYANVAMSKDVTSALYPRLKKNIAGKTQFEAVNMLLNWVQTAFVYEYDDKVWGGDRAFFAEETLYYPYCDCEDRAILFSRLVRDLLGLKVILVYYPGHLASAVCFTKEEVAGDYIQLGGNKFIVTDPTYIGAPVGWTMPGMDNKSATVILLD